MKPDNMVMTLSRLSNPDAKNVPPAAHLHTTAGRECYMPQDRFFALYGLVPRVQNIYPINYGKDGADVAREITSYIVDYEYDKRFWTELGLRDDRLHNELQPSWVPDFSRAATSTQEMHGVNNGLYGTDSWSHRWQEVPPPRIMTDNKTLHIWAKRLDTCDFSMAKFPCELSEALTHMIMLVGWVVTLSSHSQSLEVGAIIAQFLVCHGSYKRRRQFSLIQLVETFCLMFKKAESQETIPLTGSQYLRSMLVRDATRHILGKTIFVTKHHCIGISPCDIQEGDIITISPHIFGSLVLRKQAPTSSARQGQYRIVGPAIMDVNLGNINSIGARLLAEFPQQNPEEFVIW
ncbi:hypothetical protein F5B21DRAFT_510379 [Xylaria acuta]|nr:hypothetical protein F5B21DRAFT_510379 [Xylaria acuta]